MFSVVLQKHMTSIMCNMSLFLSPTRHNGKTTLARVEEWGHENNNKFRRISLSPFSWLRTPYHTLLLEHIRMHLPRSNLSLSPPSLSVWVTRWNVSNFDETYFIWCQIWPISRKFVKHGMVNVDLMIPPNIRIARCCVLCVGRAHNTQTHW